MLLTTISPTERMDTLGSTGEDEEAMTHAAELPINHVKACVCMTLQHIIEKALQKDCIGCYVNHPSQRRHTCLYEPDAYYYQTHFEEITKELYQPSLLHTVYHLLGKYNLRPSPQKIWGAVECYVHELQHEPYICEVLEQFKHNNISSDDACIILEAISTEQSN